MTAFVLAALQAILVGASICLVDAEIGLCPPDDLPGPASWTGYSTDSTACFEFGTGHPLTVSASPIDPFDNAGPLPVDGTVYLWLIGINGSYGFFDITASFVTTGDLQISGYEPIAEGDHGWDDAEHSLYFVRPNTCHRWPEDIPSEVIGGIHIEPTSVESESWGRIKALWR